MAKRLIPTFNRILVEKITAPAKTSTGILLPEFSSKLNSGKVVAVGPGARSSEGKVIPVNVKEGDTVLLPEYGGSEFKLEDKTKSKMKMRENKEASKGEGGNSSRSGLELNGKPLDFRSIMKEVELLGSSDMTWKERKDLQNKKVVSLGGKAPKKQRLPLSVAQPMMKNQKKREEKMLQEELLLGHCGENMVKRIKKQEEKHRPEVAVLKSSEGRFRNGVLNVKHLLKSAPPPKEDDNARHAQPMVNKGKKKKGGKKKGGNSGKRKGGGRKRH